MPCVAFGINSCFALLGLMAEGLEVIMVVSLLVRRFLRYAVGCTMAHGPDAVFVGLCVCVACYCVPKTHRGITATAFVAAACWSTVVFVSSLESGWSVHQ